LPLYFNKSIRNLLQRPLKRPKRLKSLWTSLAIAKTKNMSIDQISISKMDKADSPSEKLTDRTDENRSPPDIDQ
jgi:hypothetical protein